MLNPWMLESPAPPTSQMLLGVPCLAFSQAILFPPAPHGSAADGATGAAEVGSDGSTATRPINTTAAAHGAMRGCHRRVLPVVP